MNAQCSEMPNYSGKRERVTWRLDPSNYDFVNDVRMRMRLTSMNATLNVILAEHREKCCHSDSKVTAKSSGRPRSRVILNR